MQIFTIQTLFPKTLLSSNIGREITEQELNIVKEHSTKTYLNAGNVTSLDRYILKNNFQEIDEFIKEGINQYVNNIIKPKNNIEFYVTQSWLNYTSNGGYHHRHNHPNSFISGVFYFDADPEFDKITFYDSDIPQIKVSPSEWTAFNSKSWWFSVKTGDLILFPSTLDHMVETKIGENTRTSLAFNVFIKGALGDEDELTALYL